MNKKFAYIIYPDYQLSYISLDILKMVKFFWQFIKPYKWWYFLSILSAFLSPLMRYGWDISLKMVVDVLSSPAHITFNSLLFPVALYIMLDVGNSLVWQASTWAISKYEGKLTRDITCYCYDKITHYPYTFFQNTFSGIIPSKIKSITGEYSNLFNMLRNQMIQNVLIMITALAIMAYMNIYMFVAAIVWSVIFIIYMYKMAPKAAALAKQNHESSHAIFAHLGDTITNIFSLFNFSTRQKEKDAIENQFNKDFIPKNQKAINYGVIYGTVSNTLSSIFFAFNLVLIVYLRAINKVSIGDVVFILSITTRFLDGISRFTGSIQGMFNIIGALKSALSIIEHPVSVIDKVNSPDIIVSKGKIEIRNLHFEYEENKPTFSGLNLTIRGGEKVGIVGKSGCGKSTLISILLKNFAIKSGDILIDNQSILNHNSDSIRRQIAFVPQDITLFHRTLKENISYALPTANEEEIMGAAKQAHIHNYIMQLPLGYDTLVGERGIKLSGGQRQRIAIARAILKNAPILILDEATSSLDMETERQVQEAIDDLIKNTKSTVLAIAHRTSTLKDMDRIIELDSDSKIKECSFNEMTEKRF